MEKLLKSAIANWEAKNEGERLEDVTLCVKEIMVDGGRMLKRPYRQHLGAVLTVSASVRTM